MLRTNSGFVVIKSGFFREATTNNLYATKPGYYPVKDCIGIIPGTDQRVLSIPKDAVVLVPGCSDEFKVPSIK